MVGSRPPTDPGMLDPARHRGNSLVKRDDDPMGGRALSHTSAETTLTIAGTNKSITLPVVTATTVWDIKEMLAAQLAIEPSQLHFFAKQGPYMREQKDMEEIRRQVLVRGIRKFERERMEYENPIAIIGAGHIGLRTAMMFLKYHDENFVVFDKKPKVGGISWWDQANTTSKLQTELGVYHLNWDETLPIYPILENDYPWPSRNELLAHFDKCARELGILPYCNLSTNVKEMQIIGKKEEATYEFTIHSTDGSSKDITKMMVAGVLFYPGNLSLPRRETYKGEDIFGGPIAYGMFDEFDYHELKGKNVAILGHGAFAVENVRTCCEFDANQIYLVCRRKNLACPRFMSWLCNQSSQPVTAALFLNESHYMYDLVGFDPWSYWAVQANTGRTTCNIVQKARFGIGDVYFCAISWGKLEVIEDPLGIKRLSEGALHCGGGRKIDVTIILKLLGFVGNPENDRLLRIKEMTGFWANEDPKRYLVAEPISVMASNFGGTSLSPGAIQWAEHGMWMVHYPKDFYDKILGGGLLPRHKAEGDDRPAYVVDARHGTSTMIFVSSAIPFLGERGAIEGQLKVQRMWELHPIEKFIDYCIEDWNHYTAKFKAEGRSGPDYPYTQEIAKKVYANYKAESEAAWAKQMARGW